MREQRRGLGIDWSEARQPRLTVSTLLWTTLVLLASFAAAQMDYRDPDEGRNRLVALAASVPGATVWEMEETSTPGVFSWILRVSPHADDRGSFKRNSVFFECGMHGREWLASETCLMFAEWLLESADSAKVRDLLASVDVWIAPYSNPAGRYRDDSQGGDPTSFARMCIGGPSPGVSCTDTSQCGSGGTCSPGWRGNANVDSCYAGIDLARNFSSNWTNPNNVSACTGSNAHRYRGDDPFSEPETRTMRRLVHDMGFTTVVIVHAPSQEIWQMNALDHDGDSAVLDRIAGLSSELSVDNSEIAIPRDSVGNGFGQFSAWLSSPSDVIGELDFGTHRGVNTFYIELPFSSSSVDYYSDNYSGSPYQASPGDGSNTFHPSGSINSMMIRETVLPLFEELVREQRVPQCPLAKDGHPTQDCLLKDFGLVGAKIAPAWDEVGSLGVDPVSREETLRPGTSEVVFAVQNMSPPDSHFTDVDVRVTVERAGTLVDEETFSVLAQSGERKVFSWPVEFQGGYDYRVAIEVEDSEPSNNQKSFAFRVLEAPSPEVLEYQHVLDLQFALDLLNGWIRLRAPGRAPVDVIDDWLAGDAIKLLLTLDSFSDQPRRIEQTLSLTRSGQSRVVWTGSSPGIELEVRRGRPDRLGLASFEITALIQKEIGGTPTSDAFVRLLAPGGSLAAGRTRNLGSP